MDFIGNKAVNPKLAESAPDSTVGKAPAAPLRGTMKEKKTLAALTTRGQPEEPWPEYGQRSACTRDRTRKTGIESVESIPVREFRDGQLVVCH